MTWTLTQSGIEFDLIDPKPEMVALSDIAYSLSRIRRFNGHIQMIELEEEPDGCIQTLEQD